VQPSPLRGRVRVRGEFYFQVTSSRGDFADVNPKVLNKKKIYRGKVIDLAVDTVLFPEQSVDMECIKHPGGAAVVPLLPDGSVVLIKQYRYVVKSTIWEIPAGRLETGESPRDCAVRELEEEVGYRASEIIQLSEIYSAPAYCTEVIYLFLATGLIPGKQSLDDDEFIEVVTLPLDEAVAMVEEGKITDAKTVAGLLLTSKRIQKN
jgi:ADP-ribose pyrophosphatase